MGEERCMPIGLDDAAGILLCLGVLAEIGQGRGGLPLDLLLLLPDELLHLFIRPLGAEALELGVRVEPRVGQGKRRASRLLPGCRPMMKKACWAKLKEKCGSSGLLLTAGSHSCSG